MLVYNDAALQRNEKLLDEYRRALHSILKDKDPNVLIYVDETHKDRNASRRRRAWGYRGEKLSLRRWFNQTSRYTLIAAADIAGFVFEACQTYYRTPTAEETAEGACGTVDRATFEKWVKEKLVPVLGSWEKKESRLIVIMDNATTHMSEEVERLIEEAGTYLLYVSPYSPDLNPIEQMLSSYKCF